jgi:TadE-like protein
MNSFYFFKSETGATALEFAFGAIVIFSLLAVIVDFGLGFHKYSLVNHATKALSREFAIAVLTDSSIYDPARSNSCSTIEGEADYKAEDYWKNTLQLNNYIPLESTLNFKTTIDQNETPAQVITEGEFKLNCFLCVMIPKGLILKTKSTAEIENNDFECF